MRVYDLMALLKRYPPDSEVRVACNIYEGTPSSAEDLAISGLTTAFRPASTVSVTRGDHPHTLWIFAGRHLEVDDSKPCGGEPSQGNEP